MYNRPMFDSVKLFYFSLSAFAWYSTLKKDPYKCERHELNANGEQ